MKKVILFLFVCFSCIAAKAQLPITMSGYPLVYTGWTYGASGTGAAPSVVDSEVRLTSAVTGEANYLYYNTAVNMNNYCYVTIEFDFQVTPTPGVTVADGMAFWFLASPPSSTVTGSAIGLPNYAHGMILIMDTYDNNSTPDNPIETLLGYTGSTYQYVEDALAGQLCPNLNNQSYVTDGSWHHVKIIYNSGNISVYFNYSSTAGLTGYFPLTFSGYFGFSASTGALYSRQSVKNVSITEGITPVPAVTSPITYCQYATADTLHAVSTGPALHWFSNSTDTALSSALPGSPTPNTSAPGTYTYYVRQGAGLCISAPDSVVVTVNAVPAPPVLSGTTVYCSGSGATALTATGTGVLWYTADTGGVGSSTAPTPSTTTAGTYTFYASQTISGCTSLRDSIQVTVNATPSMPALTAGSLNYCQYATFVPFAVTGSNVMWYTTPALTGGSSTAPTINTSTAGSYDYYVTQTVSGCTSAPLHLHPVVNPKPAPPVTTPVTYCQYAAASAEAATGTGLQWYGPGVTPPSASAPTPLTGIAGVDTYYVTQTVLGCVSDSALALVNITPIPAPPVTEDTTYCQYATTAPLTAVGTNLNWYTLPSGGTASATAPTPSSLTAGNTFWYVTQTVNGCESVRAPLEVTISFMPVFTIASSATFVCQSDSLTLTYTGPAVSSYSWALPAGAAMANGSLPNSPSVMVKFDAAGNHNYVALTAGGPLDQCRATDTIDIKVVPQPSGVPYTRSDACLGDTLVLALSNQSANADSFYWTVDNTVLANSPALSIISANTNTGGPFKISWSDTGVHVIQLMSYTIEGCMSAAVYDTVKIIGYPDATFTYRTPSGELCIQDSVLFTATDNNYGNLYHWSPDHFFHNENGQVVWGRVEEAKSIVTLEVTNPFGCKTSTSRELDPGICCTVEFPSAFSPNGDHHNDVFRPISAGYHNFHNMRIVNRWGETVFESTNSMVEWDGTFGGAPQDVGVYYYYITYDCGGETMHAKGDVTLIR